MHMFNLIAAVLSVTMSPQVQTIVLGQTAQVTATIIRDTPVNITWSKAYNTASGNFQGKVVALRVKTNGPSVLQLPAGQTVTAQLTSYEQQVTEWTFTKQGTYNFIITVAATGQAPKTATVTINVKRR